MDLTPQEQFLYDLHLNNLRNPVRNPDGSISTLRQLSFEQDGKTYNVPTVWGGAVHDPEEAVQRARQIGLDKYPSYNSQAEAESRYNQMHQVMEKDIQPLRGNKPMDDQSVLGTLLDAFTSQLSRAGNRMSGMFLPPEQRSIMPGVNELNAAQRAGKGMIPYVDPELLNSLAVAGTLNPGGKYYHGTPYAVAGELEKSRNGLAGPGVYLTNSAKVAGGDPAEVTLQKALAGDLDNYAFGSTYKGITGGPARLQEDMALQSQAEKSWTNRLLKAKREGADPQKITELERGLARVQDNAQLGPNVRPYQVKPHETFNMDRFLDRGDLDMLRNAVLDPKVTPALDQDTRNLLISMLSHPSTTQATGADLMYGLQTALTPALDKIGVGQSTNDVAASALARLFKDAGFGSISYAGGKRLGAGITPLHDALNILDTNLIQPYFDYAAKMK